MLDILIANGEIVDGTGAPRHRADVAIADGRIAEVGSLTGAEARQVIDASGCAVTPGFVDMHSHTDFALPLCPTADSLLHQGITTAVIGQCGQQAPFPAGDAVTPFKQPDHGRTAEGMTALQSEVDEVGQASGGSQRMHVGSGCAGFPQR